MLLLEQVDDLISTAAPLQTRMSGGEHEIDELLGGHVPARISGALCHCHARQNADKVTVGVHVIEVHCRGPRAGVVLHYDHALRTYVINRIYGGSSEPSPWFLCFLASEPSVLQRCQASASCGRSKAAEAAQERSVKRAGRMLSHSAALSLNQPTSLIYDAHKADSDAPPWGSGRGAPLRLEHRSYLVAFTGHLGAHGQGPSFLSPSWELAG